MCGVRLGYEGLPGRLWACYSCQLMSDTILTDLSLHIHDSTLGQDILRCTNLGSLTEKRPRKVGCMLFVAVEFPAINSMYPTFRGPFSVRDPRFVHLSMS